MGAAQEDVLSGLVGFYPLDRVGTNTLLDHSLYGHHLRNKGNAQLHPEGGLALSDAGDPVEDASPVYSIFRKLQNFSIAFDVYSESAGTLLSVDDPLGGDRQWRIIAKATDTDIEALASLDGSTTTACVTSATSSIRNRWVRVLMTYNGTAVQLYVDGEVASANVGGGGDLNASAAALNFGGYPSIAPSSGMTGAIKNLMVWDLVPDSSARALIANRTTYAGLDWTPNKLTPGEIGVYLFGGQSNATGSGAGTPADVSATAWDRRDVWLYTSKIDQDQLFYSGLAARNVGGVGIDYGMAVAAPSGSVIIGHAQNGTDLARDWAVDGGAQFETWKTTVSSGLADLRALGYTPVVKGIAWDQGTGDTSTLADAEGYEANLVALVGAMRSHASAPNSVFCIVQIDDEEYVSYTYLETVRAAQARVGRNRRCVFITHEGYAKYDHVHRDWGSQLRCGVDIMKAIATKVPSSDTVDQRFARRFERQE